MDRQTLDMEGARQGEISAASLQLGDDTIAIHRIATMTVESNDFFPWDMPRNRQAQSLYATSFVGTTFFALCALAWWGLLNERPSSLVALFIGGFLLLVGAFCGIRAVAIAMKLKRREQYYRLVIGTSDGRQIPLVDDNRDVLCKIRDVVRQKMDTDDRTITGDFDLNLDIVNLKPVGGEPPPPRAAAPDTPPPSRPEALPDAEDEPMPRIARGPASVQEDHQDALFDKAAEILKSVS
ncbi:MAG: phage holin family protein [Hyphomonas sp.]|nr:phage holin family protein [Hyphomonas sp.]